MWKKEVFLALLLAGTEVLIPGCVVAAVGVGAGTVAYVMGNLKAVEAKNIDAVYNATKKAIAELELKTSTDTKDAMSAVITARDAQDKKITIKLEATTQETTKLSVRVGWFGNETKSRLIYDKIRENLE